MTIIAIALGLPTVAFLIAYFKADSKVKTLADPEKRIDDLI